MFYIRLSFLSNLTKNQVIAAEGEQKASRALKEASDIITESAAALQLRSILSPSTSSQKTSLTASSQRFQQLFSSELKGQDHHSSICISIIIATSSWMCWLHRYLQTLTQISAEKNSTIIFPLPLGNFVKQTSFLQCFHCSSDLMRGFMGKES